MQYFGTRFVGGGILFTINLLLSIINCILVQLKPNNMKTIEVATAELKNGIYEVHYGYEENGIAVEDLVTHISEAMLNWYVEENESNDAPYLFSAEQLCEKYLTWYNKCSQVSVTLDKPYELIYTAKRGDILAWLLVDEELNIIEPHKLPNEQQHKLKYEAHFKEATKNEPLKF